jgi:DNA repair exonuclease SbcCD ATPase subunit
MIKQMTIGGFRGILAPLTLDFSKANSDRSMVIYGRNGTGKSSITDAWEWFHTEKILHLAREGAGPSSFPHKNAQNGETYVEIVFKDNALSTIRLDYNHDKITKPVSIGDIEKLRSLSPHPCHIRFEDLTRFVYLTKTDRYDALAQLMGFTPQVEIQKSFRRILRKLREDLNELANKHKEIEDQLKDHLELKNLSSAQIQESLNRILERYKISPVSEKSEFQRAKENLAKLVDDDPISNELSSLHQLKKAIESIPYPEEPNSKIRSLAKAVEQFVKTERDVADMLLLDLYEKADEIILQLEMEGEKVGVCPLCNQPYMGDLHAHISTELSALKQLKESRDNFLQSQKEVIDSLPKEKLLGERIEIILEEFAVFSEAYSLNEMREHIQELEASLTGTRKFVAAELGELGLETVTLLEANLRELNEVLSKLENKESAIIKMISNRIQILEEDTSRKNLVIDYYKLETGIKLWTRLEDSQQKISSLDDIADKFEGIVDDYVQSSIYNVQKRFDVISQDVQKYFGLLESDTDGLGKPELKLLTDVDRAVELQVEFHGTLVYPAYRYLSESQLNSFGLSIFLASTKYFNDKFRFLILDDVINSFDGYKRPKVIELLKREFTEHQVLLLTHDSVWCDRLYSSFPNWIRQRIKRYEPNSGPFIEDAYAPIEIIEELIEDDEPVRAGRNLGPFLEQQLQELCEAFEALVKYNQKNEYTLEPLMDRFRVRIKDKLTKNHPLYKAVEALQDESGFRNLCAHWKNPDIQLTLEEMKSVLEKWKFIAGLVRCQEKNCYQYVGYDGNSGFICPCGATHLEKI